MNATSKRLLIWIPAGIALAAALAWLFRPQPVAVDLAEVRGGPLVVSVTGEGQTRVRDLYVVSAPVAGRMRRIEVEAGDPVVAGSTVIARIEPGDPAFLDVRSAAEARAAVDAASAAREHAEAQVRRAQAELDFARSERDRVRKLAESHTVSTSELEAAESRARACEAALEEARAEVRVRRSEYQAARARMTSPGKAAAGDCVNVRSPAAGHVLRVVAESEGIVQAGAPLVEIGDPDDLEVVVDLLSSDAVQVQPGQRVAIEGWGGTRPIAGAVRLVEPIGHTKVSALGIEEQRVDVVIDILEPRERWAGLGHGYRVEPRIVLWAAADVLKVPLSATVHDGDAWAVFVYEDGRAVPRKVRLGHQDGIDTEVVTGLKAGERVVLNPKDRVQPGQRVTPRD